MSVPRILCLFVAAILLGVTSASAQLQIEPVQIPLSGSLDPTLELNFKSDVTIRSSESFLKYEITSVLSFDRGSGEILMFRTNEIGFSTGQLIGPGSNSYTNSSGYSWILFLQSYVWEVRFPGNHLFITPGRDLFPGKTNILIGFARQHPFVAGTQYGWVRMQRETADTKNAFRPDGTAKQLTFMPTAFAVNPIPDQPIRAGEPPDLPQLVSEVLPPEEGLPTRVRVSWAAGWANMRLESAVELGNPVQWSPVLEVTGTEAVFELPDDGQLYLRLAYVP
jgi:hypothetical protein